jgi:hypothetical protein
VSSDKLRLARTEDERWDTVIEILERQSQTDRHQLEELRGLRFDMHLANERLQKNEERFIKIEEAVKVSLGEIRQHEALLNQARGVTKVLYWLWAVLAALLGILGWEINK